MEYVPHSAVLPATAVSSLTRHPGTPYWELPSLVVPPTCAADQWLASFTQDCGRLAQIRPVDALLRSPRLNIKTLLDYHPPTPTYSAPRIRHIDLERTLHADATAQNHNATGSPASAASSVSTTSDHPLVELMRALLDRSGTTTALERAGLSVSLQRLVAWLVQPTRQAYQSLMPDHMPRPSQLTVPHCQWIDLIIQGPLRDAVIERQDIYANDEFQALYASSLRLVNWPGHLVDALHVDSATGAVWLVDNFAAHALRSENWRFHPAFVRRYPEFTGVVEVTDG